MRGQRNYFRIALLNSIVVAIIFPLAMTGKPIDWDCFSLIMALSFFLTWSNYSMISLDISFWLKEGTGGTKLRRRKKEDPSFLHSIQEWEALWEIAMKRYKDPPGGNPRWN